MDWKLLLIGAAMAVLGFFIVFRFRKSNFNGNELSGQDLTFVRLGA